MLGRDTDSNADERVPSVSPVEAASAPFELRAGTYESPALAVVSLRGREAISEVFSFEVTVTASTDVDDSAIASDLLGSPARLMMQAGASAPRFVRGVIAAVAALSAVHGRRAVYRLRLVPALWLLKKRTTSRIFQEKTVPEIVAAVLDEAGVAYALHLLGKYRPRTYCVQHRETDLAFVERLLAEEGIFYTFDHGGADAETEIVSLSDSARLYPPIEGNPELAYRPHQGAAGMALDEHHVQRFELRRSLRPTSVLRRGYDFRRPALALTAEATLEAPDGGEPERGEIYEHHEEDEEPNIRQETVTAELEQHRAGVEVAHGSSGCRRLVTGARFKLRDHDLGRLDAEYVVTSVTHEGRSPETATQGEPVYANTFECVPATVPARPPRPARSLQQVTETALVVGPEGQEVYTDEYGRVKVQFHWDREGQRDERSSCWIRVAQAWAGSGWGFEFVPRIGMEVVVTFLGGDVDRPLITGCVPNAFNRPPFQLPENKTQSGIRTQSTPGGGGFNELLFDDAKNAEVISIRAQKNLVAKVLNDHRTEVGGKDEAIIAGDRVATVQGKDNLDVTGGQVIRVAGRSSTSIGAASVTNIAGNCQVNVAGDSTSNTAGGMTIKVDEYHRTVIGVGLEPAHGMVAATGNYRIGAAGELILSAGKRIVFACGESSIELSPTEIRLTGPLVTLIAAEGLACTGKQNSMKMGDTIEIKGEEIKLFSKSSSLVMDDEAKLDGKMVKLNCDPSRPKADVFKDAPREKGLITFRVDPHLESDQPFTMIIQMPTGELIEKQTDSNREVQIEGFKGDRYTLVEVRQGDQSLSKKRG